MNLFVNDDGDIELDPTTNNLRVVTGQDEIKQIIIRNLETIRGEWFLDTSLGIPWLTEILSKDITIAKVDSIIIEEIGKSSGVLSILSYDSNFDKETRTLSVEFSAQTVAGIINFSQNLVLA